MRKWMKPVMVMIVLILISLLAWRMFWSLSDSSSTGFDGQRAYKDVRAQVAFGPRIPGSPAHQMTVKYIQDELKKSGWKSNIQDTSWSGFEIKNIIASRSAEPPQIILGAHYDSRLFADQDLHPNPSVAVLGANDGASGVAVLLELARCLPPDDIPVWLVFFDGEDNGGLEGRSWIMGSRAFAASLDYQPRAAIIVDMVGDSDQNIFIEKNSNQNLVNGIWEQAAKLGFEKQFINSTKYSMLDDHTPFLEAGIPAVDIIDFDYPFWHTTSDTVDKVSPKSLYVVGETLRTWIGLQK
jgi:glutaminyl-peptide cyclotransferase